jgi:hypothetical protein
MNIDFISATKSLLVCPVVTPQKNFTTMASAIIYMDVSTMIYSA